MCLQQPRWEANPSSGPRGDFWNILGVLRAMLVSMENHSQTPAPRSLSGGALKAGWLPGRLLTTYREAFCCPLSRTAGPPPSAPRLGSGFPAVSTAATACPLHLGAAPRAPRSSPAVPAVGARRGPPGGFLLLLLCLEVRRLRRDNPRGFCNQPVASIGLLCLP